MLTLALEFFKALRLFFNQRERPLNGVLILLSAVLTVTQAILFNKCRQFLLLVEFCMVVVAVAGAEMSRLVQLSWSYHLIAAPIFRVATSAIIIFSNSLCCCFNFIL